MNSIFKRKYKFKTMLLFGFVAFIIGLTCITYAGTYNSSEITYDTSTSGAVQNNVKDALDFLYKKTKAGSSSECPENMSCVLKPGVTMNVTGPGTVDKGTVYVGIGETNTFTVTPTSGYALHSITCSNGYTLSSFSTVTTSVQPSLAAQTITITNPNTANGATCTITFGSNEINVSSSWDTCNSNSSGCICYQIKYNITNFTYGSHTSCNFKSTACSNGNDGSKPCNQLNFNSNCGKWEINGGYSCKTSYGQGAAAKCSGVITCAT